MRNHSRSERRRRAATDYVLFPSTWPWRALYPFCEELLATVYPKSSDLWQELRSTCTAVIRSLEHHDYEGDITRDDALSAVVGLLPVWPNAEVKFRQAQTLLGRDAWNSMVARAVDKCGRKELR